MFPLRGIFQFSQDTSIGSEATEEQMINSICRVFQVSFREKTPTAIYLPELEEAIQQGIVGQTDIQWQLYGDKPELQKLESLEIAVSAYWDWTFLFKITYLEKITYLKSATYPPLKQYSLLLKSWLSLGFWLSSLAVPPVLPSSLKLQGLNMTCQANVLRDSETTV